MSCCLSLACLALVSCQAPPLADSDSLVHRSRPLLGTFVTISAIGTDRWATLRAVDAAFAEFERVDALMSIHRPDSELARVNATADAGPVSISPELFAVLQAAQSVSERTSGAFDVTLRPVLDLWGFISKDNYRKPSPDEIQAALARTGYQKVILDRARSQVHFVHPGISIDLGGIAKGYAVDLAIERLSGLGITNAMVKAGGDLRVSGHPPGQTHWTVQLEDPLKAGRRTRVRLRDAALSTSGNYENFFEVDGQVYSHILDPRTGNPAQAVLSCTVVAPRCLDSDALATAFMVLGVEQTRARFGDSLPCQFWALESADPPRWHLLPNSAFSQLYSD